MSRFTALGLHRWPIHPGQDQLCSVTGSFTPPVPKHATRKVPGSGSWWRPRDWQGPDWPSQMLILLRPLPRRRRTWPPGHSRPCLPGVPAAWEGDTGPSEPSPSRKAPSHTKRLRPHRPLLTDHPPQPPKVPLTPKAHSRPSSQTPSSSRGPHRHPATRTTTPPHGSLPSPHGPLRPAAGTGGGDKEPNPGRSRRRSAAQGGGARPRSPHPPAGSSAPHCACAPRGSAGKCSPATPPRGAPCPKWRARPRAFRASQNNAGAGEPALPQLPCCWIRRLTVK